MAARPEIQILISAINKSRAALTEAGNDIKKYTDIAVAEGKRSVASFKDIATSMSGVVTAGFSLYSMYDNVEKQQLSVMKASNRLEDAERRVKNAQEELTEAIAEGGAESEKAVKAREKLKAAEDDAKIATEHLRNSQQNLNEAIVKTATFAIPSLITFLDRGKAALDSFKGSTDAARISQELFNTSLMLGAAKVAGIAGITYIIARGVSQYFAPAMIEATKEWNVFTEATREAHEELLGIQLAVEETGPYLDMLRLKVDDVTRSLNDAADAQKSFSELVDDAYRIYDDATEALRNYAHAWDYVEKESGAAKEGIEEAGEAAKEIPLPTGTPGTPWSVPETKSAIPSGVGLGQLPEGTYLLEKHSPAVVTPYIPPGVGTGTPYTGYIPPGVGTGQAGGPYYPPSGGYGPRGPTPTPTPITYVSITAAPQITQNIMGPVQPAMVPVLARETKKAAYEGVSEALRDELRRKGIPIWTGE